MFQQGYLPSRSRSGRNCGSAKTCLWLFTGSALLAPVCTHYGLPCSQPIDGRNHILGPVVTAGSAERVDMGMQVFNDQGLQSTNSSYPFGLFNRNGCILRLRSAAIHKRHASHVGPSSGSRRADTLLIPPATQRETK